MNNEEIFRSKEYIRLKALIPVWWGKGRIDEEQEVIIIKELIDNIILELNYYLYLIYKNLFPFQNFFHYHD